MTHTSRHARTEYGDFQTPLDLAKKVCEKLRALGIAPDVVIEPTCGIGAFVETSAYSFPLAKEIIGVEINEAYLAALKTRKRQFPCSERITIKHGDFFDFDWNQLIAATDGSVLVIGNFPWVTNSQQGAIGGANLPDKINFQDHSGFDALTGKSNFDISEWMLMQAAKWLMPRKGHLAMLCKTSVARRFVKYLYTSRVGLARSIIYGIDAQRYFGAAVDACLLICDFDPASHNYDYDVYESLDNAKCQRVGHRNGVTIRDLDTFEKLSSLYGTSDTKWRSGVKHDCSAVMEFREIHGSYMNGLGETVEIEPTFLFPLLKGSDIANDRLDASHRYMLVTQKTVGEKTDAIKVIAPKTWAYLETHAHYLDERKSRIYHGNPRYSVFGVGGYTFAPYKIAICSLYKNLDFRLVGQIAGKPVVFDDTVYFLSFDTLEQARKILDVLMSSEAQNFYSALIFWDEKRPIKTSVLNSLNLLRLDAEEPLRLF